MPQIYLSHPIHGRKIASLEAEPQADEQNGWTRYNPDTPSDSEEAAVVNELGAKRKYTRRAVEAPASEGV